MSEARKNYSVEINHVQTSLKAVAKDIESNTEAQTRIEQKVGKIDNTRNKNLERITRLEQSNIKLCEDMKLLEEREKRRSLSVSPKVLETQISETRQVENRSSRGEKTENS